MRTPLLVLASLAVLVSLLAPAVYTGLVAPTVAMYYKTTAYSVTMLGNLDSKTGMFIIYPLFILLGLGFCYAVRQAKRVAASQVSAPYMCGEQLDVDGKAGFRGPLGQPVAVVNGSYYMERFFGEDVLTKWINAIAIAALVIMLFGGAL